MALPAGGWAAQTPPYPGGEGLPTVAAACNGRGDPPAARWPGKERVQHRLAGQSLPPSLHTSTPHQPSLRLPYQQEVLVPLQLLQALGQPQPLLLPGLFLQAPELLVPFLFPGGFALHLAQGDHCGEAGDKCGAAQRSRGTMKTRLGWWAGALGPSLVTTPSVQGEGLLR